MKLPTLRKIDIIALSLTALFFIIIGIAIARSDVPIFSTDNGLFRIFQSERNVKNLAEFCNNQQNKNKRACVDMRMRIEADWQSVRQSVGDKEGSVNQFTLH